MGYFNRGGRDNRGGGHGFSRGRDDKPREMFKTVCSNCGNDCEVPFKPTSGKPVYCSDCFEKVGGRSERSGRPERNPRGDRPQTPRVDYGQQFERLNKKMDKIIELLTPRVEVVTTKEDVAIKEVKVVKTPKDKQSLPLRGKKTKKVKTEATA